MAHTLPQLRTQIDALDRELLALLNRRAGLALEVGEIKRAEGSAVFRPDREAQVIAGLQGANPGPLKPPHIAVIWREVMSACRSLEAVQRVAFLGPAGTFSEQAALQYFGSSLERLPCVSIDKVAAAKWSNVMEFCDWMSQRCGGTMDEASGTSEREVKNLLEVAQTIALLSTISEREKDQNVVTLSTLHASKGLEWPHVMLVGVTEGMLPFKLGDGAQSQGGSEKAHEAVSEDLAQRLQEERRLMYVGITRAQRSLAVSWTRRRKKGREMVAVLPSRFIAEMGLDKTTTKEDPREKLKALRAEFALKALESTAAAAKNR